MCEPEILDVNNKVCFAILLDIPNTVEESKENQSVTEWYRCDKCGVSYIWVSDTVTKCSHSKSLNQTIK